MTTFELSITLAVVLVSVLIYSGGLIAAYYFGRRAGKNQQKVNNTEAIFGFGAWLTTRKESITVGSAEPAYDMLDLCARYCFANGFPEIRETHYPKNLKGIPE